MDEQTFDLIVALRDQLLTSRMTDGEYRAAALLIKTLVDRLTTVGADEEEPSAPPPAMPHIDPRLLLVVADDFAQSHPTSFQATLIRYHEPGYDYDRSAIIGAGARAAADRLGVADKWGQPILAPVGDEPPPLAEVADPIRDLPLRLHGLELNGLTRREIGLYFAELERERALFYEIVRRGAALTNYPLARTLRDWDRVSSYPKDARAVVAAMDPPSVLRDLRRWADPNWHLSPTTPPEGLPPAPVAGETALKVTPEREERAELFFYLMRFARSHPLTLHLAREEWRTSPVMRDIFVEDDALNFGRIARWQAEAIPPLIHNEDPWRLLLIALAWGADLRAQYAPSLPTSLNSPFLWQTGVRTGLFQTAREHLRTARAMLAAVDIVIPEGIEVWGQKLDDIR